MKHILIVISISCLALLSILKLGVQHSTSSSIIESSALNNQEISSNLAYKSGTLTITIEPVVRENPPLRMWITTVRVKDTS